MPIVIIWTIALIVDISTCRSRYYTGLDLVVRDMCIIMLGISLLILK